MKPNTLETDIICIMLVLGQSSIFNEAHIDGLIGMLQQKKHWKLQSTTSLTNKINALHNSVYGHWKFEISSNSMIRIR